MKKITITFDEDGNAIVDVEGCEGDECIRLTDALTAPFQPKVLERKLKPEYYRRARPAIKQTTSG